MIVPIVLAMASLRTGTSLPASACVTVAESVIYRSSPGAFERSLLRADPRHGEDRKRQAGRRRAAWRAPRSGGRARAAATRAPPREYSPKPSPVLVPEPARVDELAQRAGHRELRADVALERLEHARVGVEPGHVGDQERAEERQAEAEGGAHDLVEVLARREALVHERDRLAQQRHLEPVGDEARRGRPPRPGACRSRAAARPRGRRSRGSSATAGMTSMPGVHSGGLNQCTPRKRAGSRTAPASPSIGSEEVFEAMIAASGAAAEHAAQHVLLERVLLGHRLDDEVGVRDRRLEVRRRRDARGGLGRLRGQQPGVDVPARALEQLLPRLLGELGRGVDERDPQPGARQVAGDAAAHGPAADHGHRLARPRRTPPRRPPTQGIRPGSRQRL